ncbi:Rrf2 family transcriptional regulator [Betaproteobacteria bacterium SCN1]|jgi:Rrf2 family nitric oxide-sensitive transcriptional repressor|nr:Rrf2 family transcriptional regulator [Betaproteobacteria bacterium SCN1]MBN8761051.1 Rrf2 family transcriptional regulator [Thiobacillus sp.]ODU87575.1 MAG: Rrf2 family transcriptional regulator [Thiobacillus sp. SCN 65-179]OJW38675.1 MAG: Rrf2 family transcriptional regulator [Thiobacillus sp. 65-69]
MRLTLTADYALRLLMYVAQHPDRLCTIAEIAQVYGISEAHLMKVTHQLGQQGWIETVRGKGGGMRLARMPRDIRLGAVVRDMEPDFALVECFGPNSPCTLTGDCRLSGVLGGALEAFIAHLERFTLADILPGDDPVRRPVRIRKRQTA